MLPSWLPRQPWGSVQRASPPAVPGDGAIVEFQRPCHRAADVGMTLHTQTHVYRDPPSPRQAGWGREGSGGTCQTFLSLYKKSDTCVQSPEPPKRGLQQSSSAGLLKRGLPSQIPPSGGLCGGSCGWLE